MEDIDVMDNMFKALKWTEFRNEPNLHSETRGNIISAMLPIAWKGKTSPQRLLTYFMTESAAGTVYAFAATTESPVTKKSESLYLGHHSSSTQGACLEMESCLPAL